MPKISLFFVVDGQGTISKLADSYGVEIGQHFVGQVVYVIQLHKGMIEVSDNKNFFNVELGVKCYHKSIGDWVDSGCLKIKIECERKIAHKFHIIKKVLNL